MSVDSWLIAVTGTTLCQQVIELKFSLDDGEDRVQLYPEARPAVTGSHRLPPRDRKAGDEALNVCQCCGSGSVGSICYCWPPWIRILLSSSINSKKNLGSYCFQCFVTSFDFLSSKNDVNAPSKSYKQKNFVKILFLLAPWRSMTKITGSGSISQRHGSADLDPDPYQDVMDPQHWFNFVH